MRYRSLIYGPIFAGLLFYGALLLPVLVPRMCVQLICPYPVIERVTTLPFSPTDDDPFTLSGVRMLLLGTPQEFQEAVLNTSDMVCVVSYVPGVHAAAEMVQVYAALARFFAKRNLKFYRCYVLACLDPSLKTSQVPSLKVYAQGTYQKEYTGRISFRTLKRSLEQDQVDFAI